MLPPRVTGNFLWLLPVLLSLAGNNEVHGEDLKCHEITDGSSFNNFKDCKPKQSLPVTIYGNTAQFVRLDFSGAAGDEITQFFAKEPTKEAKLSAAIRLINNNKIVKIDFGKVKTWTAEDPKGEIIVEIVNNPSLETIIIDKSIIFGILGSKVTILVYNNPKLKWDPTVAKKIDDEKTADSYFEQEEHACTFQNPTNLTAFITPVDEILENCKKFKGDLKLDKGALKDEITFVAGCLSLVGVDMTGVTMVTAAPSTGNTKCGNGDPSEIKNNKGLCGDKMTKVKEYFNPTDNVTIELDQSCTKTCTLQTEVEHPYYRCKALDGTGTSLFIEKWFIDGSLADNRNLLKSAKGTTSIMNTLVTTILLPHVKSMDHLEIMDNTELTTLELPQLGTITELTITGNEKLHWKEIKKLSKALSPTKSTVECRTGTDVITDVEDLRLCTIIVGQLTLKDLKNDVDASKFSQLKEIRGCITVENTELSNIDFLDVTISECTGGHMLKNNPKLCTPGFLEKNPKVTNDQTDKNAKCGKICTSLTQKYCVIFDGDLVIGSSITAADIQKLETVNGKLAINGTTLPSLEFPALTTITSSNAPALVVVNNPTLAMLKMPKMAKISAKDNGKPLVVIEKNPLLTDLSQFLPASMQGTCSRSASSTCLYDLADQDSPGGGFQENLVLIIVIIVVLLLAAAGGGGFIVWWCVFRKRKYKKEAKADTPTPTENEEDSGRVAVTVVEKEPKFEVIEAIQEKNPKTNNQTYFSFLAEHIVKQWHGPIQFRIMLRGSHTEADIVAEKIDKEDLDLFQKYRAKANIIVSDRINLNRKTFLVNKDYKRNDNEFFDALFEPAIKGKKNKKKDEKKKADKTKRATSGKDKPSKDKKKKGKKGSTENKPSKEKKGTKGKKPKNASKKSKKATKEKTKASKTSKASKKSSNMSDVESGTSDGSMLEPEVVEEPRHRAKLIHIGSGFEKAMETVKGLKLTVQKDSNKKAIKKVSEKFPQLTSTVYLMEYTKGEETYAMEVELTEMKAPDELIGKLLELIQLPWFAILFYAWQHDIVVHTSLPDYLVMSFYVYTTIDLLNYRIGENMTPEQVEIFPMSTMYPTYHKLFAGKNQTNFDEITAFTLWATAMMEWARDGLPTENALYSEIKAAVKQVLLADAALLRKKKLLEEFDMLWDIYNRIAPDKADGGIIFSQDPKFNNNIYYNRNPDPTPWSLPPPAEKLKYGPWLEYDEKQDCLVKEAAEKSGYTKPQFGTSLMTVAPAPPVEAKSQMTTTTVKDEEKTDKKENKKEEKKGDKKKKTSKVEESPKKKKKAAKKAEKTDETEESQE